MLPSPKGAFDAVPGQCRLGVELRRELDAAAPRDFGERAVVEAAAAEREAAADPPLQAHGVLHLALGEAVPADRHGHAARHLERLDDALVGLRHLGVEEVAVVQLDVERALVLFGLHAGRWRR